MSDRTPEVSSAAAPPLLSVVVPMHDEAGNAGPLIAEIARALGDTRFEIVAIDDGSADSTAEELRKAGESCHNLRVLHHRARAGQSMALISGVRAAHGPWIATIDGDGQNDPSDIPELLAAAQAHGGDPVLIAGFRIHRRDSLAKRWGSRFANTVRARLLGDATPDTGCGLKVFRRADFLALPQFDHMHRFLPALFVRHGGTVLSLPVNHRPRTKGRSHYGSLDRLAVGIVDLAGVWWLKRRWRRPEIDGNPPPGAR